MMHEGRRQTKRLAVTLMALATLAGAHASADQGPIAGVDAGVAVFVGSLEDRTDPGAAINLFGGYMFNDYFGLTGQAQFVFAPVDDIAGFPDDDVAIQFGLSGGPRVEIPFGETWAPGRTAPVLWLMAQPGFFTNVEGHVFGGPAVGVTAGGGLNLRLCQNVQFGPFARYTWVDDRVTGDNGDRDYVSYVTAGIGFTYNPARAPVPVRAVAAAPPPPAPAPRVQKRIVLRGVNFDFDKAVIRPDAQPVLDEAIATLRAEGDLLIVAEGHTDAMGTDAYNEALSLRRARAVRDYLVAGGIPASRVEIQGYGESRPVATNETEVGRAQNRRVELRVR